MLNTLSIPDKKNVLEEILIAFKTTLSDPPSSFSFFNKVTSTPRKVESRKSQNDKSITIFILPSDNTAYDIYAVAIDFSSNFTAVVKLDVTTVSNAPPAA